MVPNLFAACTLFSTSECRSPFPWFLDSAVAFKVISDVMQWNMVLLHFTWGVADAKFHACLCVSLSLATFPYYCTDPDVTWGNGKGVSPSCALSGRFAVAAWVSLLWQHSTEREISASACTRSMPGLWLKCVTKIVFVIHFQIRHQYRTDISAQRDNDWIMSAKSAKRWIFHQFQSVAAIPLDHHTTPQPFYDPFSGTTRVRRCQKRTSGLYGARED